MLSRIGAAGDYTRWPQAGPLLTRPIRTELIVNHWDELTSRRPNQRLLRRHYGHPNYTPQSNDTADVNVIGTGLGTGSTYDVGHITLACHS